MPVEEVSTMQGSPTERSGSTITGYSTRTSTSYKASSRRVSLAERSITFSDLSICRASRSSRVLSGWGKVFKNSDGSALTYALSEAVGRINVFISHNWTTPRSAKYAALSVHMHWNMASVVSMLAGIFVFLFGVTGLLPAVSISAEKMACLYCLLAGEAIFWPLLFFGYVPRALTSSEDCVFLDKTCIHQTDPVRKQAGIESLGAFLYYSDQMLSILQENYFNKLWTVYEFAAYILTKRHDQSVPNVKMIPTGLPKLVCILHAGITCVAALSMISSSSAASVSSFEVEPNPTGTGISIQLHRSNTIRRAAVIFVGGLVFGFPVRWGLKQNARHIWRLRNFRLQEAKCFVETDRMLVNNNIHALLVHFGHVTSDSLTSPGGQQEALTIFDSMVRSKGPDMFHASTGRNPVQIMHLLGAWLPYFLGMCDTIIVQSQQGGRPEEIICSLIYYFVICFIQVLIGFPLCVLCEGHYLDLEGWRNIVFTLLASTPASALYLAMCTILDLKLQLCLTSGALGPALLCCWLLFITALACYLWRPLKLAWDFETYESTDEDISAMSKDQSQREIGLEAESERQTSAAEREGEKGEEEQIQEIEQVSVYTV